MTRGSAEALYPPRCAPLYAFLGLRTPIGTLEVHGAPSDSMSGAVLVCSCCYRTLQLPPCGATVCWPCNRCPAPPAAPFRPCVRKQGEADRGWFCVSEPGVRDVDHVITTAELGSILQVGREGRGW